MEPRLDNRDDYDARQFEEWSAEPQWSPVSTTGTTESLA